MKHEQTSHNTRRRRTAAAQRGFTMIEILIVALVVILLIAVAIPGFIRSRRGASENMVKARLSTVAAAQSTFRSSMGRNRYATLGELRTTAAGGSSLISPTEVDSKGNPTAYEGWMISQIEAPTATTYGLQMRSVTSERDNLYCLYEDGVVRVKPCVERDNTPIPCFCDRNANPLTQE